MHTRTPQGHIPGAARAVEPGTWASDRGRPLLAWHACGGSVVARPPPWWRTRQLLWLPPMTARLLCLSLRCCQVYQPGMPSGRRPVSRLCAGHPRHTAAWPAPLHTSMLHQPSGGTQYYELPFCQPKEGKQYILEHLGEVRSKHAARANHAARREQLDARSRVQLLSRRAPRARRPPACLPAAAAGRARPDAAAACPWPGALPLASPSRASRGRSPSANNRLRKAARPQRPGRPQDAPPPRRRRCWRATGWCRRPTT